MLQRGTERLALCNCNASRRKKPDTTWHPHEPHHPFITFTTGSLGMDFLLCAPDILEHTESGMLLPSDNDVFHLHLPCHFVLLT